jgi:hypothetical protein
MGLTRLRFSLKHQAMPAKTSIPAILWMAMI